MDEGQYTLPCWGVQTPHSSSSNAWYLHVTNTRPLYRFDIVALDAAGGGETIEASDHKQAIIDHGSAEVTAGVQQSPTDFTSLLSVYPGPIKASLTYTETWRLELISLK